MPSPHGALVVFGSGPGVGRNVAQVFASRGFDKVVLLSRNADRLSQDADFVRSARAETTVYEIPTDLGDIEQVQQSLVTVSEKLSGTPLECVLFNAARTGKSEFFDFPSAQLVDDLKISIVSLYAVAQWAIPQLTAFAAANETSTPSLLVTSGMLAKDPFPAMFSLATCKAGQYSLVQSLYKKFESKCVHCGLVIIGGTVSDESKVTNARNIAEETWKMFKQSRGRQDLEIVLTDPAYEDHVKNRER